MTTPAPTRRLTSLTHVKRELSGTLNDDILNRMIDAASSLIHNVCHTMYAREAITFTLPGFQDVHLDIPRTPIISVSSVLLDTDPITDYAIASRDEGQLYRRDGWEWTRQVDMGLSGRQRWPGYGQPLPRSEEPRFTVAGVFGYILPEQNIEAGVMISASSADNSFNSADGKFPPLLQAGDVVVASGFKTAANNGRFLITGTPTPSKVLVSTTLVNETAGPDAIALSFEPPADCRPFAELEEAAIEAVRAWWFRKNREAGLSEKMVGDFRLRWNDTLALQELGLPPKTVGILKDGGWVKSV